MNHVPQALLFALLMIGSVVTGCLGDDGDPDDGDPDDGSITVKIGLLTPQTGGLAAYSQGFEAAARVAITALNAANSDITFELVVGDTQTDASAATSAASTLIAAGVVGIAGAASSASTLAAITPAKEAMVPMVSYASTSPAVTTADDGGYLWRVVPSDAQQGVAMSAKMVDDDVSGAVCVAHLDNAYGSGFEDAFSGAYGDTDTSAFAYPEDETDFSSVVASISSNGCMTVLVISYATDGAALVKAIRADSSLDDVSIYGGDGIADATFANEFTDESEADGIIVTRPRTVTDSAAAMAFDTAYMAAGGNTSGIYTRETYDVIMVIGAAVALAKAAGALSGETVNAHLDDAGTSFAGASGVITFDAAGDVGGNGYDICDFTYSTDAQDTSFDCAQVWTAGTGVTGSDDPALDAA